MSSFIVQQFKQLWESERTPPDVFEFLQQHSDSTREDVVEILLTDQVERWKTAKPLRVEDYLEQLPDLAQPEIKLQLAIGEFQSRQAAETSIDVDEFTSRFSDISDALRSKLEELAANETAIQLSSGATSILTFDPDTGTGQLGRYRLERMLGEGAFGRVYLAYDDELRRQIAVKVPTEKRFRRKKDIEQFLQEARTVASLNHPNIVPVYDTGRTDSGSIYVVSRFIEGQTLGERMKSNRPGYEESARLLASAAYALHHAHQRRLVHRDVKPANILLEGPKATPYVADFGLAIREEDFLAERKLAGTPAYMSPEQARCEAHRLDGRSDVFSLGVILYELLTGKRPFRGSTHNEILHQVISVDPPPPRDLDPGVPVELERICLKALSKRSSDRYSTAAELAEDLHHWNRTPEPPLERNVVPKGLRSFDAADADFFLDLLPGPRNRNGLPDSIQFWKSRIEESDADKTFSIGLIYGPSGCGKSSMMKAGLLPNLSRDVTAIYLEATPDETETRILRGLRKSLSDEYQKLGLVELMSALRRSEKKCIVIIIDQFEQWLHAHRTDQESELVSALRQCNGGSLQAVVMVRDDFAMAAARFMDWLDVPIIQGHNFATVDLFDMDHARKVLIKFGQAFEKLPQQSSEMSAEQESFVESVTTALAVDGKVVSVRLALFAEMIKGKPWKPSTLEYVGGSEGIGVNFLEETFGARTANPKHHLHQQAAREVLKALLPEIGSDIKGHMRSHQELMEASGYNHQSTEFNELLRILDGELRLITPTDPEGFKTDSGSDLGSKFYQLTHDYLVPSLRDWLTRKQQETRKGRAELKLAERTAFWNAKQENRHLPSLLEWISIRALTEKKKWNEPQKRMMSRAGKVYGIKSTLVFLGLVSVWVLGYAIQNAIVRNNRNEEARKLVANIDKVETSQIRNVIDNQIEPLRAYARDDLSELFDRSSPASRAKLHAALAMLPEDRSTLGFLKDRLLTVTPVQFEHVRDQLLGFENDLVDDYWKVVNGSGPAALRFQAACALAAYDPENTKWTVEDLRRFLSRYLVEVRPSELRPWIDALRPIKLHLVDSLTEVYCDIESGEQVRSFAADALADYLEDDHQKLFDLLGHADENQFRTVFKKLENFRDEAIQYANAAISESLATHLTEDDKERLARKKANSAVMLMRMDAADQVWPLLKHSPDPRVRSYIIHFVKPRGVDYRQVLSRFDAETDVSVKRGLLYCLGEFDLDDHQLAPLIENMFDIYRNEPDTGLHSAAEWLLRKWGEGDRLASIDESMRENVEESVKGKRKQKWFINSQGQSFAILDADKFQMGSRPETELSRYPNEEYHLRQIAKRLAFATKEVTRKQWRLFYAETNVWNPDQKSVTDYVKTDDCPMVGMTWYQAAHYCNWLSMKEGISEDDWCYEPNDNGVFGPGMRAKENFLALTGYRLPTEAEWEFACRAGAQTSRYFGGNESLLAKYAWYQANGDYHTHPVASLKPNDFGLFDMQGNVYEWCFDVSNAYPVNRIGFWGYPIVRREFVIDNPRIASKDDEKRRVLRGGSFSGPPGFIRSAFRDNYPPHEHFDRVGFRPVRTLEKRGHSTFSKK